jgi:hypothetical protein
VIKWECSLCWKKIETEVKPPLIQRLCGPCKVRHYTTVVGIYQLEGGFRLDEAKLLLQKAKAELKEAK